MKRLLFTLLGGFLLTPSIDGAHAETMAEKLADLRAEVETLSATLTDQKTDNRNTVRALARQKSDLQIDLDREKLRLAKARAALSKKQSEISAKSATSEDLTPLFNKAVVSAKGYVEQSIPFRTVDRLAEIEKIVAQEKSGALTKERALSRLWGFIEDEIRMTKESALFRQSIQLGGENKLVDVIRIGMVMMFFKEQDDSTGYAIKTESGWSFKKASGQTEDMLILKAFDMFKKQIKEGLFVLPNVLPKQAPQAGGQAQ